MPTQDIPAEIRKNLMYVKSTDKPNRDAYRNNIRFLNGDQWESGEAQKRRNRRLMLTADMLNAPVDQIVNGVRQNKPGPAVSPSGGGTDKDDAEIFAGLLRRIDYENRAWIAMETAMECATGGNFGCMEVDIAYKNPRSFERVIVVKAIPNANDTIFFDPAAMEKDRSDAEWAIQICAYSREKYKAEFPHSKISKRGPIKSLLDYFGTISDQSMAGWLSAEQVQIAKYWKFERDTEMLRLYTNGIAYWDSEKDRIPADVEVDESVNAREVEHKVLKWYLSDGVEVLKQGDWDGDYIPLFPVYGRERWVDGKRCISSMIELAKQAQQAFNFAFTGACEVLSLSTKAPWIGLIGQFKTKYADWKKSNTELLAYLEFDEVPLANGQTYITPPQRNLSEPPVQAFLAFCALCTNAIQRATSFFDPSLGKQKSDQSGKAIQELQAQSAGGNFHWSDNLTICLTHYYRAIADLVQREYDAPQVTEILRADGTTLSVEINKTFKAGVDKAGKDIEKHYKISKGNFAFTVAVGPSFDSQMLANESKITSLIKVLPPEMVAQAADLFIRLQNYGPLGDQLAERLTPPQFNNPNDPNAAAQHLAQAMQENKQLQAMVQQLHTAIATKQPELEVRKWIAAVNAIAGIEEKKIQVGSAAADREQSMLETVIGLSHEAGMDATHKEHEVNQQQAQQQHEGEQATQEQQAAAEQQQAGVENEGPVAGKIVNIKGKQHIIHKVHPDNSFDAVPVPEDEGGENA